MPNEEMQLLLCVSLVKQYQLANYMENASRPAVLSTRTIIVYHNGIPRGNIYA